ncbi:MAG TPA: glutamine amidotransferase [Polyangiaceae bacterium]|nr:glutamine amidotransferase [Polyangiaceae bacterium]
MTSTLGLSADLPLALAVVAFVVAAAGLVLLVLEARRRRAKGWPAVVATGLASALLALAALLRPVVVRSRGSSVGPKVVVLVDRSRSMLLPGDGGGTRDAAAAKALEGLARATRQARVSLFGFGEGAPSAFEGVAASPARAGRSDLVRAARELFAASDERPRALVVVSDGRLTGGGAEALRRVLEGGDSVGALPPVHAVSVARREPRDASLRAIRFAGTAVAHQPFQLTIEVGCGGGLSCESLPVTVRELLDGAPPTLLATGAARVTDGQGSLATTVTLDRAGPRLVEVTLGAPAGDELPENDRRVFAVDVARERVRVLHVAGRPTYDVRALRTWLKANASVDVVAFFILRSNQDDVMAGESELALIKFPVDELFTEHLPSFDAVILQDFNAIPYGLSQYLGNLAKYVESGGGLVMVGGPDAFLGGGYDGTPLERALPVDLDGAAEQPAFDLGDVVPRVTAAGAAAPVLGPLRALLDELPPMPGANLVGAPKPGSLVLWEHPTRRTRAGQPMPLLTLGETGDGRAVAIALDGAHRLGFSEAAAKVAGRGHGALWDGLLGWLMRDPRFEPARVETAGACVAGEPTSLRVMPLPGTQGTVTVEVTSTEAGRPVERRSAELPPGDRGVELAVGPLPAGGYLAKVRVGSGSTTRHAFACEKGGDEWADSRPDEGLLRGLAEATGGTFRRADEVDALPLPPPTHVSAERSVAPVLPAWLWTLGAAVALGAHWIARRRAGLA